MRDSELLPARPDRGPRLIDLRRILLAAFLGAAIAFSGLLSVRPASSQVVQPSDTVLVKDHARGIVTETVIEALADEAGERPDPAELADLVISVKESVFDGLNPADYDLARLEALQSRVHGAGRLDDRLAADVADAMRRSFLKLAFDLRFGRGDIGGYDESWHFARGIDNDSMAAELRRALDRGPIRETLRSLRPQHPVYAGMREHLALYLRVRDAGGWRPIPADRPIMPGVRDDRVPFIRETLSGMRDLPLPASRTSPVYDPILVTAVARFQERHGLPVNDTVNAATLKAMSVPVEKRIEGLRANLERARWFLRHSPDTALYVNIPTFDARLVAGDSVRWSGRVQVGMIDRKTPVLYSTVQSLEFNPRWTVPKTILEKDIVPRMARGTNIVKRKNLVMYDFRGNPVDPLAVDWNKFSTAERFPYLLRQDPGAGNALGRVKFVFPNEHGIYLHDTPSKSLFAKENRTLSSGCVRVENPFALAAALLDDPAWTMDDVRRAALGGTTRRVWLKRPMPIALTYWTATIDGEGRLIWYGDAYGTDPVVLAALRNAEEPDALFLAMQRKANPHSGDTSDVDF